MLRITSMRVNGSPVTLKLEGKIFAEWVDLLERECLSRVARQEQVILDMSGVTFLDNRGVELLRSLPARYISLVNCSDFVVELLDKGE